MKKIIICFIFIISCLEMYAALWSDDFAKGPLYGKNMYIPYIIYYNAPAISAQNNSDFAIEYHLSTYIMQDFITYPAEVPVLYDENHKQRKFIVGKDFVSSDYLAIDYESYVSELGLSVYLKKCVQIGLDMRVISYCGGFLDAVIEGFHKTFGFPNGGREYFQKNVLKINIKNTNGIKLKLDDYCTSFGDMDFWVKWTFFKQKYVTLASLGAFKIPTGQLSMLSGSGYPDLATGLLVDVTPCRYVSIYSQFVFVLPFDSFLPIEQTPYPMFNMMISLEVHPIKCFSILGQFSFKTPAISGTSDFPHQRFIESGNAQPFFSYPQTNVLAGFEWKFKNFTWQFYFEEETFLWAGVDITLNCLFKHKIDFKNFGKMKRNR